MCWPSPVAYPQQHPQFNGLMRQAGPSVQGLARNGDRLRNFRLREGFSIGKTGTPRVGSSYDKAGSQIRPLPFQGAELQRSYRSAAISASVWRGLPSEFRVYVELVRLASSGLPSTVVPGG